jgi:hypothetical protein
MLGKIMLDVQFTLDDPPDELEAAKQWVANSTDCTPGLSEAITEHTWKEIFIIAGYNN